jgi:hypothetical protein
MEVKMEIKFNRKNESSVERFIYRYRLTGFLLELVPASLKQGDCRNDNPTYLIQHKAKKNFNNIIFFSVSFHAFRGLFFKTYRTIW